MFVNSPPRKRFTVLTLCLLMTGALALGSGMIAPDVEAVFSEDCYCDGPGSNTTQMRWGKGSTCAASLADLDAQASADYQNDFPVVCDPPCGQSPWAQGQGCDAQLVVVGHCGWDGTQFVSDGYYSYGCFTCP